MNLNGYDYLLKVKLFESLGALSFLEKISKCLVTEIDEINHVVYDVTSKPPSTIEWE